MEKIQQLLKQMINGEHTFSFKVSDESFLWQEDETLKDFNALSSSALLEEIHRAGYIILKDVIPLEYFSVVSKTSLNHLKTTPYSFNVYIKLFIRDVKENVVLFEGEAFDEIEKIADFSFERVIVSKNYLKRKLNNKAMKISNF